MLITQHVMERAAIVELVATERREDYLLNDGRMAYCQADNIANCIHVTGKDTSIPRLYKIVNKGCEGMYGVHKSCACKEEVSRMENVMRVGVTTLNI